VHHVAARGRPRAEPEEEGGGWSGWVPLTPAAAAAAAAADADAAAEAAAAAAGGGEPTAGGGGGADGAQAGEPAADADADAEAEPPPEAGDCQPRPDSPDSLVFAGRRPLWCNHAAPADAAYPPDKSHLFALRERMRGRQSMRPWAECCLGCGIPAASHALMLI